jgi:hypothetical protein
MRDEASALQAAWMSDAAPRADNLRAALARVRAADEADHARHRKLRVGGLAAMVALVPVLIWATAYGVTPLVRVAYALMAVGCVAGVVAHWLYHEWSRRALPGPDDMRSQLQRTAFLIECQVRLGRTAAVWTAPVFSGILLICVWLYRERTAAGAIALAAFDLATWIGIGLVARRGASALERRRQQLQRALADLESRDSA